MLSLPASVRIFVCRQPTDMRRSFDALAMQAFDIVKVSPQSGHLFVFFNKRRDKVKVLWWDRAGYTLLYKRIEHGRFHIDDQLLGSAQSFELHARDLMLILEGVDLRGASRRLVHDDLFSDSCRYSACDG